MTELGYMQTLEYFLILQDFRLRPIEESKGYIVTQDPR